jgi:hypothetical protein
MNDIENIYFEIEEGFMFMKLGDAKILLNMDKPDKISILNLTEEHTMTKDQLLWIIDKLHAMHEVMSE